MGAHTTIAAKSVFEESRKGKKGWGGGTEGGGAGGAWWRSVMDNAKCTPRVLQVRRAGVGRRDRGDIKGDGCVGEVGQGGTMSRVMCSAHHRSVR